MDYRQTMLEKAYEFTNSKDLGIFMEAQGLQDDPPFKERLFQLEWQELQLALDKPMTELYPTFTNDQLDILHEYLQAEENDELAQACVDDGDWDGRYF